MEINLGNVQMLEPQRFSRKAATGRVLEFANLLRQAIEQDDMAPKSYSHPEPIKIAMMSGATRELLDGLQLLMAEAKA